MRYSTNDPATPTPHRRHSPIHGQRRNRRQFFAKGAQGIGALALASLLGGKATAQAGTATGAIPGLPHFAPKAKRCIYLHLVGAPPQMETWDYKPTMQNMFDKDLPNPSARASASPP